MSKQSCILYIIGFIIIIIYILFGFVIPIYILNTDDY